MMKLLLTLFAASSLIAPATELVDIPFKTIKDKDTSLADYDGKVVLIVNTASKCGLTKQYEGLEKLYKKYKSKDFEILAFPCNDFGKQEPGNAEEIQKFCKTKYAISFPLMAKIHVKGEKQHPLYTALTGPEAAFPGEVKWNFGKILIGKDGEPIARFNPNQKPQSPKITSVIEKALE
ncbi:glutathione peroxidase [Haloferula sp.]|uniref:glutathione peroxidase n=1 Tax=Haloferula sp. TaxID=2497595 RepID=UPI00329B2EBC